jgi:mannose-6-phosphate isomerase-like protein (cupin superfamily)
MFMSRKHKKSAWVTKSNTVEKPWGHEVVWSGFTGIHAKTLHIKAGCRTSFKYNTQKNETLFLRKGSALATFGNEYSLSDPGPENPIEEREMKEGDVLHVQSCCPYRIEAIEDCEIIEVGNSLTSLSVRIEDDFGRCDNESDE